MPSRLLVAHFLRRLVENDFVSPDADRREVLAFVASTLVAFASLVSAIIATKYLLRPLQSRGWTAIAALDDTFVWTGASMLVMAAVALAAWDALSLDARDTEVLGTLPVRHRTIVAAQACAVAMLALGCAVAVNLVPTLAGPIVRVQRLPIDAAGLATLTLAHGAATMAAGLFGFLSIVAAREVLRAVLGHRGFQRASGLAQGALVVCCATMLLMLPGAGTSVERRWLSSGAWAPPPLWFVGLHEAISGESLIGIPQTGAPRHSPRREALASAEARLAARYRLHQPAFRAFAARAGASLAAVFGIALVAWAWNSRRLPPPPAAHGPSGGPRHQWMRARLAPAPCMRAGFEFALEVLTRSAPHRMIVAVTAGVAVACAAGALSALGGTGDAPMPAGRLLAAQSLVVFVVAGGLRRAIGRPAAPDASATFVLAGGLDAGSFREGVRRGATVALALPALVLMLPAHAAVFGAGTAAWHGVVGFLLWLVVSEAVLPSAGVPFVTPADRSNNQVVVGVMIAIVALQVSSALGWFERLALGSSWGRVLLPCTLSALWLILRVRTARRGRQAAPMALASPAVGVAQLRLGE